jgi:hypothetical protein
MFLPDMLLLNPIGCREVSPDSERIANSQARVIPRRSGRD